MTMKSVDPAHLRSVVLAGHAGSGKTTLAEQLLFRAGAVQRLGRVDDGTAHLDFEPEEQKRKESLSLAVATFEHDGTRITLIDTPGYPDFVSEAWVGLLAPAKAPRDIVARLNAEITSVLGQPEMKRRFAELGLETAPGSPADLDRWIRTEMERWGRVIRERKITLE